MNKQEKKYLDKAIREKRPHERFNSALARVVSDGSEGETGYKFYINLMNKVRKTAGKKNMSKLEAAEYMLGRD